MKKVLRFLFTIMVFLATLILFYAAFQPDYNKGIRDGFWFVVVLLLWPIGYIVDNFNSILTGAGIILGAIAIYAVIYSASVDKHQREERLHKEIDDLKMKIDDLRTQLDDVQDSLRHIKDMFGSPTNLDR